MAVPTFRPGLVRLGHGGAEVGTGRKDGEKVSRLSQPFETVPTVPTFGECPNCPDCPNLLRRVGGRSYRLHRTGLTFDRDFGSNSCPSLMSSPETIDALQARVNALADEVVSLEGEVNEKSDFGAGPDELGARQRAFVREYLLDNNATQAALRAGYSPQTAHVQGCSLLKIPKVANAIARDRAVLAVRVGITKEAVLSEMGVLANSCIDHYFITDDGQVRPTETAPPGAMGAISSIKRKSHITTHRDGSITKSYDVEIRLWDKPTPLRLLGKHVGLAFDRVEVTGKDGGPIVAAVVRQIVEPTVLPEWTSPERPVASPETSSDGT